MSAAAPAPAPPPSAPPRRRGRWLLWLLVALGVLLLGVAAFVAWLTLTAGGARFALDQGVGLAGGGVRYENLEGRLAGPLRIGVLEIERDGLEARIEGLEIDADPMAPLRGTVVVHRLHAKSVEVTTADTGGEKPKLPARIAPPWPVVLEDGRVDLLRVNGTEVRDVAVRGRGDARQWQVDEARAVTEAGEVRVAGTLQAASPYALDATIAAAGRVEDKPWKADAAAKGSLQSIDARLAGEYAGQPATGRVVLEPFAPLPVRSVALQASGVDLSRLLAEGPKSQLDIEASLDAAGRGTFAGPIRIENRRPGPWNAGRFPFESASGRVVVQADRVDVADLALALRGGGFAGGRATVRKAGVEADLAVKDVNLAALHDGLQATRITGRIAATGDRAAQRFDVDLRDPRFAIEGDGSLAGTHLVVDHATVKSGGGAVTASGEFEMAGEQPFRIEGRARHFDPSAFARTGKGDLNFTFVASGEARSRAGEATLEIAPSRFAGLPLSGRVAASGDAKRLARADVRLSIGDARVEAKGSFGRAGDALDVAFKAPDLAALAKPFGIAASGRAQGEGRLTGTFQSPAGRLSVTGADLVLPSNVFVKQVSAHLEAGMEPSSRIAGTVKASGVAIGEDDPPTRLARTLEASLEGTRAAHRLRIAADMRRDTVVRAAFEGGLDPNAKAPGWNGRLQSLEMTGRGAFRLVEPATLAVSASRAELGPAVLRGQWGEARLDVSRWTPRTLELKGSTPGIQIQNLARSLRLGTGTSAPPRPSRAPSSSSASPAICAWASRRSRSDCRTSCCARRPCAAASPARSW